MKAAHPGEKEEATRTVPAYVVHFMSFGFRAPRGDAGIHGRRGGEGHLDRRLLKGGLQQKTRQLSIRASYGRTCQTSKACLIRVRHIIACFLIRVCTAAYLLPVLYAHVGFCDPIIRDLKSEPNKRVAVEKLRFRPRQHLLRTGNNEQIRPHNALVYCCSSACLRHLLLVKCVCVRPALRAQRLLVSAAAQCR